MASVNEWNVYDFRLRLRLVTLLSANLCAVPIKFRADFLSEDILKVGVVDLGSPLIGDNLVASLQSWNDLDTMGLGHLRPLRSFVLVDVNLVQNIL
jgi:hypothetical protein